MKAPLLALGLAAFGILVSTKAPGAQPPPYDVSTLTTPTAPTCLPGLGRTCSGAAAAASLAALKGKGRVKKKAPKLPPLPVPVNPTPEAVYKFVTATSQIDPILVLSIVATESSFHAIAKAMGQGVGHYGVMQLALATARSMGYSGTAQQLYNWQINIRYGMRYIAYLESLYPQRDAVIAAFNSGTPYLKRGSKTRYVNQGYVNTVKKYYAVFARIYTPEIVKPGVPAHPQVAQVEPVKR